MTPVPGNDPNYILEPSSPSARGPEITIMQHASRNRRRSRPSPRRRRREFVRYPKITPQNVSRALFCLGLLLPLPNPCRAQEGGGTGLLLPPSSSQRQRSLEDGLTACAGCATDTLKCSGTTIMDANCEPCATGQRWWPCNEIGECYCKNLAADLEEEAEELAKCDLPLCDPGESGSRVIPFTACAKYVSCDRGVPGSVEQCSPGQMYSPRISACNIVSQVACPEDPKCPSTGMPTTPPATGMPTMSPTRSTATATTAPTEGSPPSSSPTEGDVVDDAAAPIPSGPRPASDPSVLEGLYVLEAHMNANKIALTRELLTGPGGGGRGGDFSYLGLRSSLRAMIVSGAANRTFYVGDSSGGNGRVYGLVNVAAFLAMSAEDSIRHGSCDEVNRDARGGVLPTSNACGQGGRSYADETCPPGEEKYACEADPTMRATAGDVDLAGRNARTGRGGSEVPPKPFYCGPASDYGGSTGHWDDVIGAEVIGIPTENGSGRTDVEGCCWWGRGSIQLRGVCAYGRLNYHLGKRAHDEGRPSLYPDVDFCRDPQAVCSPDRPGLAWVAGLFRWITEVQAYDRGDFEYSRRLRDFVDGGLRDWTFVRGLSGIVTQGCHEPPCAGGAEFVEDGADRKATFIKTLRLLGLSPNENDGTASPGRRLGE